MFTPTVAVGERVALWSPGGVEPDPRLRVLLPGEGASARARAATAEFVPSVQQASRPGRPTAGARRRAKAGPSAGRQGRSATGRRTVVLPGDPSPMDTALAEFLGHRGGMASETDRDTGRRLGVTSGVTEVGLALIELGCWRTRISDQPPGPDLVAALAGRPDQLAPAPVTDPDEALTTAVNARTAEVSDRVVTGWANAVLESITARNRVLSWLQAEQYTDLAMLSRNYPGLAEMLPTEIAFALRTSEAAAGSAIATARAFSTRLPGTLHALHQGLIDVDHAIAMARATGTTTVEVAGQVENDLLGEVTSPGSTTTPEQLRRRAARRVIIRDPDGATDRHNTAAKDRHMTRWAEDDGMAGLRVIAPAQQIAAIWEASTAMADANKVPGDKRPLGARRVDALTDICNHILGGTIGIIPSSTTTTSTRGANGDDTTRRTATGTVTTNPAPTNPAPTSADTAGADTGAQSASAENAPSGCTIGAGSDPNDERHTHGSDDKDANGDNQGSVGDADADADDVELSARDTATETSTKPGPGTEVSTVSETPRTATLLPIPLGSRHGRKPHIQVVVPYTVLLGSNDPCELVGHGTITADQARLIIADGTLQRLLCDPVSGLVLDYGRTRYQPPETLKQFLIARDGTCRSPGCNQPADRCEIDHVIAYRPGKATGGSTDHLLLDAKCKHHHRAKDGGGFSNTRDPDGTSHWTTPLGRQYTLPPHSVWHPTESDPGANPTDQNDHDQNNPDQDEPDWADRFPAQPTTATSPEPEQAETDRSTASDEDPPPF